MVKVTSALSREGVSCLASNEHGKKEHVFHFGSGRNQEGSRGVDSQVALTSL